MHVPLHYTSSGQGTPLLLLHGWSGTGADFDHLFDRDALARAYCVISPDLPGHGRSPAPRDTFVHRAAAHDVFALLDALSIDRVRAVGVSMGANTLLHMATQQPARIEAMVLVSATTHFPEQARVIQRAMTFESLPASDRVRLCAQHAGGEAQVHELCRYARRFAESTDDLAFTPERLGSITARTLIVYGDRDPLYPVEIAVAMLRGILGSSLWVVPNAGHAPVFTEPVRSEFVARALSFVR